VTKPEDEKRTASIEVCVTPAEKTELIAAAKEEGMQTSTFMRIAALKVARN
jgi:uncharacterized protein (DUF1778 family)